MGAVPGGGGQGGGAVWVEGGSVGVRSRCQHFALFFLSQPSSCFFSNFRGLSLSCGGLCAFSSLKMSSPHTFGLSGYLVKMSK